MHYLAYHVAMGMSGLLLYTDAVQRHYLRRVPALQPYLTAGHLRWGRSGAVRGGAESRSRQLLHFGGYDCPGYGCLDSA